MSIVDIIQERIDMISPFFEEISQATASPFVVIGRYSINSVRDPVVDLQGRINKWQKVTAAILLRKYGDTDPNYVDFIEHWRSPFGEDTPLNEIARKLRIAQSDLESIIEIELMQGEVVSARESHKHKPPKVFISHKNEDKAYADALVTLINFILGPEGDKVFCSSIPGYGIHNSRDILNELKAQFDQNEVYMIIIHSPRYYKSATCLNEMGASWVLGTRFCSFMTKDCKPEHMRGVINREKICIDLNDSSEMVTSRLNDFKDDLIMLFNSKPCTENKWEHARGRFINEVMSFSYDIEEGDDATTRVAFAEEELEILRLWVSSGLNTASVLPVLNGKIYILGGRQYLVEKGRQGAEWDDFFIRLQDESFISLKKSDNSSSIYELQKKAYELFDNNVN